MATVTFAGTTIWDDSTSGIGPVESQVSDPVRAYAMESLIRGNGAVAKDLGLNPGSVNLALQYRVSSDELNTLLSALYALIGTTGTVTIPPGQSYSNCIMLNRASVRGPATRDAAGTVKYPVTVFISFARLAV